MNICLFSKVYNSNYGDSSQVILAIVVTWVICAILTAFNVFPDDPNEWGSAANTNIRLDVLHNAPWFRFPYPGQVTQQTYGINQFLF